MRPEGAIEIRSDMIKPALTILLAGPRGFCAGVDRAILIVEKSLEAHGAPIYVRHEIVHNRFVVENLEAKGAVFVEELDQVPDGVPVVFSAHGVPKSVPDATCPLVSKVHFEAERHHRRRRQTILIGHANHPEVVGTMGQVPEGSMVLVETVEQAETISPADPSNLAFVTQTTLSVDDTKDIVDVLRRRFPDIVGPRKEDICYATTNRQNAVKAIAARCDMLVVIGAANSSNSKRLVEVGIKSGCQEAVLVNRATEIPWENLKDGMTLGVTAGASAPEILVEEVIARAQNAFEVSVKEIKVADENVTFNLPRALGA
jgi:4-hydroxy-3-methylbut-2-enyl diphosphate reductase